MGPRHPPAHGAGRHQPPAGHAVGRAHATRMSSRLASHRRWRPRCPRFRPSRRPRSPADRGAPPPAGRRGRHGHRRGQDMGRRPAPHAISARRACASPPGSRRSPSIPTTTPAGRDAAVLGAATGESPEEVCPPHRWYEVAMAPPMAAEALGRPPSPSPTSSRSCDWPARGSTWGWSRPPAACARPWRRTATAVSLCQALDAGPPRARRRCRAGHDQRGPPDHRGARRADAPRSSC